MEDETAMSGIPRRSIGSSLARAIAATIAVLALGPAGAALAAGPEVTITSPSAESSTRNQTPPISGTTTDLVPDQVTVTIYPGTTTTVSPAQPSMTATPSLEGFWSVTPATLADGTYTALATQTNGLTGTGSSTVTFTVDTPPEVSVNPVPSPTKIRTPTLEGHAGTAQDDEAAVTVVVYLGEPAAGNVAASREGIPVTGGAWSFTPSSNLADGTYTVQAIQRDALGQGVSSPVTFTVEAAPPTVTLNSPASPSGNTKPSFTGSASDVTPVTVDIYAGSTATGTVVSTAEAASSGGSWTSNEASPALAGGPNRQYTAVATEPSSHGNPAGVSAPVTFTVETASPTVTLNAPASPSNNTTPSFTGSASDVTPVTVDIYAGSTASGTVVSTAEAASSGGSWTSNEASPALAGGPNRRYTAVATEPSSLGNPAGVSSPVTFTVDTTPPAVSIEQASPTNESAPTLKGHVGTAEGDEPSVTVRIEREGGFVSEGKGVAGAGGWSYTPSPGLFDGTYTAQATQRDTAGNIGTATVTFTIDTKAPSLTIATPQDGAFINSSRPTFSGSTGNEPGDDPTVALEIYNGTSVSGEPAQTATIPRNDKSWTTGVSGPRLANGTYTVRLRQSDEAHNTGTSVPHTFTVKTDAPLVTLHPLGGLVNDATPSFNGEAATGSGDSSSVTLNVYPGTSTSQSPVESLTVTRNGGTWATGPVGHLADGTYTAQAQQADAAEHMGVSATTTFKIDTMPPLVTLPSPANGSTSSGESQPVGGAAGVAKGDLPAVTIQLFTGSTVGGGEPLESVAVNASKGLWSATLGGLGAGTYTVRAVQRDQAGNLGVSGARTFTVPSPSVPPPPPPHPPADSPPTASFTVFPTTPRVGESISLASSSTDVLSPIVAYAWDLAGAGVFQPGGPVLVTSFAAPGDHLVRLRVTAADGLSSVVAHTIRVAARRLPLMQPFPIVRIVGSDTRAGARLTLLSAQVPVGARVTVRCRGRGCPTKVESRIAVAGRHTSGAGTVAVTFRRFERSLRAGVSLEIRVSKPGEIGKYTRFGIRRSRPPVRVDACLDPTLGTPTVCPSS